MTVIDSVYAVVGAVRRQPSFLERGLGKLLGMVSALPVLVPLVSIILTELFPYAHAKRDSTLTTHDIICTLITVECRKGLRTVLPSIGKKSAWYEFA